MDSSALHPPRRPTASLRWIVEAASRAASLSLDDLTVLDKKVDPYRFDTPAGHRDGAWFGNQVRAIGLGDDETIHLRGVHYAIAARGDVRKPDGSIYVNDLDCWLWLETQAANRARWLGYVGFEQIADRRNAAPIIRVLERKPIEPFVSFDLEVYLPEPEDLHPRVAVAGFVGEQPYRLVIFGEKSSLEPVLAPIAKRYGADLFLPTGEISSTQVYQMCRAGAADGRPMIVFTCADFDPSGHQMPVSIARKVQAFRDLEFHELEYEIRPVSLLAHQVAELDLPSTPLKPTERRADRWREAMGHEQTEVDALATLQPGLLRAQVTSALDEFYDHGLAERVADAKSEWLARAQEILEANLDHDRLRQLRGDAETRLVDLEAEIAALNAAMRAEIPDVQLPPTEVPEPWATGGSKPPLIDSRSSWVEQTLRLIDHKAYGGAES